MLNLVSDVIIASFAIAHTHSILLQVRGWLHVGVIFLLLATESLINQIQEDPLT